MNDNDLVGKKIISVPKEIPSTGIDYEDELATTLLVNSEENKVDISVLESFSSVAQTRDHIYSLIDSMALDDRVSAVLETYAEDSIETNDSGQIVWCESSDSSVNEYVTHLIDELNIDKYIYEWVYSLIKYGDVYLQIYKKSDFNDNIFDFKEDDNKLYEAVNLNLTSKNDRLASYVELVSNPAEMFELTKNGKTMGFIKAPVQNQQIVGDVNVASILSYKFKKTDIEIYSPMEFVHASLKNDNSIRYPEEVNIFINDEDYDSSNNASTYKVKKGQSILFNQFQTWKVLSSLENSIVLSRLTKSAVVRMLQVEVGEEAPNKVPDILRRLKSMIEQKSALSVNKSLTEYTNPGPIDNIVYLPTRNGKGKVESSVIGGDYDPKQLTDLDYFLNKFYGSLRVPKQYFSETDDSTGFNGGTSLSIISSRYGKSIKMIQSIMCSFIEDLINRFLIDKKLFGYINKFKIRMQSPVTQEEIDRRENTRGKVGEIQDIINILSDKVKDNVTQLKMIKSLLSAAVTEPELINLLQEEIDRLESNNSENVEEMEDTEEEFPSPTSVIDTEEESEISEFGEAFQKEDGEVITEEGTLEEDEDSLPNPSNLEINLLDYND